MNDSDGCEITDSEVTVISQLKWPYLKRLSLSKYVLN
jgi:hypothetical protein